ncbi:1-phosphatidylinositol-3-phosphate 5-kinase FAB1B-like protein [Drosera capensis]
MDQQNKSFFDMFGVLKSWIPWQSERTNVSRDFWMPDYSCRVCYECDLQFTIFNRKHHCRHCGRIFCSNCTSNFIPAPSDESGTFQYESDRIRVCNFCFKQWELGLTADVNGDSSSSDPSSSPSVESFSSIKSCETPFRSIINASSLSFSAGQCERISENSSQSPYQSALLDQCADTNGAEGSGKSDSHCMGAGIREPTRYGSDINSDEDDDEDEYSVCGSRCNSRNCSQTNDGSSQVEFSRGQNVSVTQDIHSCGERNDSGPMSPTFLNRSSSQDSYKIDKIQKKEGDHYIGEECEAPSSKCAAEDVDPECVDFENSGLLWLPPEPENEEDERELPLFDEDEGDGFGDLGCLQKVGSFGSVDEQCKERCNEEHKKAMKNIVDGHFRALVSQLLLLENIPVGEEKGNENWLEIITSLSWEAAVLLKPDMSRGGGMDPGGYVKVKCIPCGCRSQRVSLKKIRNDYHQDQLQGVRSTGMGKTTVLGTGPKTHIVRTTQGVREAGGRFEGVEGMRGSGLGMYRPCIGTGFVENDIRLVIVKGVVCKKNVAHRRMAAKIDKPRILILGGALEYQRVSNHLSSFDTLLQQEMDHLKMAVAKIDAQHPDILLVEKTVSRFAQDYILGKSISLVLNIKRPLLERIARCTGAQVVPSVDHLSSQKLGYCESFHLEKFVEEHGTAGQGGRKLMKNLMYFEGCPKPLGCTVSPSNLILWIEKVCSRLSLDLFPSSNIGWVFYNVNDSDGDKLILYGWRHLLYQLAGSEPKILLRGASVDELKKVKHVIQYSVFAAYHLALETSFLADEGASLPEVPLNEPITVALPKESLNIDRSITTVPYFTAATKEKQDPINSPEISIGISMSEKPLPSDFASIYNVELAKSIASEAKTCLRSSSMCRSSSRSSHLNGVSYTSEADERKRVEESLGGQTSSNVEDCVGVDNLVGHDHGSLDARRPNALGERTDQSNCSSFQFGVPASGAMSLQQEGHEGGDPVSTKEEFPPSPSDHQSILVQLSSRCVWKGTVCERAHLFRIKYYGGSDKPLGRFLQDLLFDQNYRCRSCEMPAEAHVQCYTHQQGTLTISVKKLHEPLLPGEQEGKIWMWHRCLRCPRINGFPPATRRVIMSDAAWGLSFGKFLELSFSNHAAASRVASCGHSLHRDCLRFYGSGKMVACFRYASTDVHSVYLPPLKLDFVRENQEWVKKEADEVVERAEILFAEVLNALYQIEGKTSGDTPVNCGLSSPTSRCHITELEGVLQNEKAEFEEMLRKILNPDMIENQPAMDILDINRLRRQLLFQSYMWDNRLVYAAGLDDSPVSNRGCSIQLSEEKTLNGHEVVGIGTPTKSSSGVHACDSFLVNPKPSGSTDQAGEDSATAQSEVVHETREDRFDLNLVKEEQDAVSTYTSLSEPSDPFESGVTVRRALSDSEYFMSNLSDTLDAAWTGKAQTGPGMQKDNEIPLLGSISVDSSLAAVVERFAQQTQVEERGGIRLSPALSSEINLSSKVSDNLEDTISWLGMPFLNFYRSLNKNFLGSAQKLDKFGGYKPIYLSSFQESELQSGAILLLPVGINETVIPVYDDEPTSVISYALLSQSYYNQLSDEGERPRDPALESAFSLPFTDPSSLRSFQSLDESVLRSFGTAEDIMLSIQTSSSSSVSDTLPYQKSPHIRISFSDTFHREKVKYTVTCYHAKMFDALRKMCCPTELDFVRSFSRCKKWGAQGGKSCVFFAKTLDDRFIIKQVTKTELESFLKFAPEYFKYLTESITSKSPTCLAKVLGIYQVTTKHLKGGKETKMDVLVMENLLFRRKVTRLYDLKGSSRSRYNPDSSGNNKVLLDQNLIEAMPTSPIFVSNKAKRSLERAVWNDTSFLASVDVMDYSLLVGVDEEKHELVLGIIDFMRQYTWDKHLETWVKASGILGGPKNVSPTVISPKQYKKRFRKAMTTYFLMIPDQWSPLTIAPSKSQNDLSEENPQAGATPNKSFLAAPSEGSH